MQELEAEVESLKSQADKDESFRRRHNSLSSSDSATPLTPQHRLPHADTSRLAPASPDLSNLTERLTITTGGEATPYGPSEWSASHITGRLNIDQTASNPLLVADSPPRSPLLHSSLAPASFLPMGTTPVLIDHLLNLYFRWAGHLPVPMIIAKTVCSIIRSLSSSPSLLF